MPPYFGLRPPALGVGPALAGGLGLAVEDDFPPPQEDTAIAARTIIVTIAVARTTLLSLACTDDLPISGGEHTAFECMTANGSGEAQPSTGMTGILSNAPTRFLGRIQLSLIGSPAMLDLRRLRILKEVARQGSLSAAARALNYSQPAISHHIGRLEEEAGTALITRLDRGVRLTEAGRALVDHVDGILDRLAAAEQEVAAIVGLRVGRVNVVAFPSAGTTLVPRALAILKARHPKIEVSLVQGRPPESLALLRSGQCDLVLSFDYPPYQADESEGLIKLPLLTGRLHAVLPPGHELRHERDLELTALSGETWIAGCQRCHRGLVDACAAAGFAPETIFGIADLNAIQGMVAAGLGVALVPALVLATFRHRQVVVRSLLSAPTWEVSAVLAADRPAPATIAMLETLKAAAAQLAAGRNHGRPAGRPGHLPALAS